MGPARLEFGIRELGERITLGNTLPKVRPEVSMLLFAQAAGAIHLLIQILIIAIIIGAIIYIVRMVPGIPPIVVTIAWVILAVVLAIIGIRFLETLL